MFDPYSITFTYQKFEANSHSKVFGYNGKNYVLAQNNKDISLFEITESLTYIQIFNFTLDVPQQFVLDSGKTVLSPPNHKAFSNVPELVDFVESVAEATGLPVGIKAAIGNLDQWEELAKIMKSKNRGPDFIAIDGGEGGTDAAPPSFANHVSLPWIYGFSDVYKLFKKYEIEDCVVWIGSGKLVFPAKAAMAFAMGVDVINVAREAMMSIGCIQAQICHTNRCPAGIATQ